MLTAHPTEVQRKSILDCQLHHRPPAHRARSRGLTPEDLADNEEALRRLVLTLWQTRILRELRLTVRDEIENGLSYYRYTFLREMPRLYGEMEEQLDAQVRHGDRRSAAAAAGRWIGGDRDGNPFVTHDVMLHALVRHRRPRWTIC